MKIGMKQLFRRPAKAILFFLLMTAATALLVFGGAMYAQNQARMEKLDDIFVTVGTVDQPELGEREEKLTPEDLDFPGADYVVAPELRPYYLAWMPDLLCPVESVYDNLLEVRALEEGPDDGSVTAEIVKVWWDAEKEAYEAYYGSPRDAAFQEGDEITCLPGAAGQNMEPGKTYIGYFEGTHSNEQLRRAAEEMGYDPNNEADMQDFYDTFFWMSQGTSTMLLNGMTQSVEQENNPWNIPLQYRPVLVPFTTQCDAHGQTVPSDVLPSGYDKERGGCVEEVTDGFYEEGGRGQVWMDFLEQVKRSYQLYPVLAIARSELLESFQQSNVHVRGRIITREEYDTGARVCMVSSTVAQKNFLSPGDKITLPMLCSLYGYETHLNDSSSVWDRDNPCRNWFILPDDCSLLNAEGRLYEPFFEAEYEIVGVFHPRYAADDLYYQNMFLIPSNSVTASDENNIAHFGRMTKAMTSFQLPNGTVEEFDRALHEAVPQAEQLVIQYSDMGYANSRERLLSAQKTALLLLAVGILAALAVVALLLYFFVVREKRRTAIERSLGMTRRRCRVSLLSGVLVLTLAATVLGSVCARSLLDMADSFQQIQSVSEEVNGEMVAVEPDRMSLGGLYNFSAKYSPWAMWDVEGNQAELETVSTPDVLFVVVPLLLFALVWLLALLFMGFTLRIEPIYLLSSKGE